MFFAVLAVFFCLLISYVFFINLINVIILHQSFLPLSLNFSLLFIDGNTKFLIATAIGISPVFYYYLGKRIDNIAIKANGEEDFNKTMSKYEAKKKYLGISFNTKGTYFTFTDRLSIMLSPVCGKIATKIDTLCTRKKYLNFLQYFKPQYRKKYLIGDSETWIKSGFPVLGTRNRIWVDPSDSHSLIVGTTNSGKTVSMILPFINLVRLSGESGVIVDLKGELSQMTYESFKKSGYRVWILDFINPECSNGWNPLALATKYYIEEYERIMKKKKQLEKKLDFKKKEYEIIFGSLDGFIPDIEMGYDENGNKNCIDGKIMTYPDFSAASEIVESVCNSICKDTVEKTDFWNDSAADLMKGLVYYLLEEGNPEMVNIASVKFLHDVGNKPTRKAKGFSDNPQTYLQYMLNETRKPTDLSYAFLSDYLKNADETKSGIDSTFNSTINKFLLSQQVKNILASNDINLLDIDSQKTMIFLKVHDEKSTYYPLVNIFMNQLQQSLIEQARSREELYLKYPFHFLWDEFGQFPKYEPVYSLLGAGRSRGIRLHLVVQGYDQLDRKYGKEGARSIRNGCVNKAYLLSDDEDTLKLISNAAGHKKVKDVDGKTKLEPIFTIERLRKFKYGDVLILRQKEEPFMSHMLPNNKYAYYRKENFDFKPVPKKRAILYDIRKDYLTLIKNKYK